MPPHTRSQRRRQNARQQPRRPTSAEATKLAASATSAEPMEAPIDIQSSAPLRTPAPASRSAGPRRRVISRPALEPIDYTKDYAAARLDLRRIALWAILLFIAMIALKFSGVV